MQYSHIRMGAMRISGNNTAYNLYLSAEDTYNWAHWPGAKWPCSTVAGKRLSVQVDNNGLVDYQLDYRYGTVNGDELKAVVSDFLPPLFRHLWPVWEV